MPSGDGRSGLPLSFTARLTFVMHLLEPLEVYFLASIDGNCTPQSIANYVIGEGDDDPFHTWLSSVNFVSDAFASIASTRHFGSPSFEPGSFQALTHDTDDAMERMANMIT